MYMITEDAFPFHLPSTHRILYVGHDLMLVEYLRGGLEDCQIVRCPIGSVAHALIKGINYSLLLFDEELADTTGEELSEFARGLTHRERTPVIVFKKWDEFEGLSWAITHSLSARWA